MELAAYTPLQHRPPFPFDKESLSISASAVGLDVAKANACIGAYIQFEGGDVRAWWEGSDPDSTTGIPCLEGRSLVLTRTEAILIRFIRISTDVTAWVIYYR